MSEFLVRNIRFFNIFLALLILAATLILARNIISVSSSQKGMTLAGNGTKTLKKPLFKKMDLIQYSSILERNPFGPPAKLIPISTSGKETQAPPKSISGLALIGTAIGPEDLSYAVFEDISTPSSIKQELFKHGEKVFDYGILIKIGPSAVEIEQGPAVITVEMSSEETGSVSEISVPQVQKRAASKNSFAKKIGEKQYILDRKKVQQSLENPEKVLTDARLLPNFKDGRQTGFIISEVTPDGLYDSLGLRNGDILLKINGLRISNPEVAIQAMSALRGMNRITLDILREKENVSLSYQIR